MNPKRLAGLIALAVVYFLVITPLGLCLRLFGRDRLWLRPPANAETCWRDRTPPGPPPQSFTREF